MLSPADRRSLCDELHHLAETFDSIGHTDFELVWCDVRVGVQRLRELLSARPKQEEDQALLQRLTGFLDEIWESWRLGSEFEGAEPPSGERERGLAEWFAQQLRP
jgi:hypothetical protein